MNIIKKITAAMIVFALFYPCAIRVAAFPFFWDSEPEEKAVPIIMYHLVTNNGRLHGKYAISPDEFESDLKYLKESGYETVDVSDLVRFADSWYDLPDKPVMLTFDDGSRGDYQYVLPLLEKYDAKAVASVVGKLADDYSNDGKTGKKPHLVWEQIEEMHKSKRIEFQNHSYNMHGGGGSGRKPGETDEAYAKRFGTDIEKTQKAFEENINYKPIAFTYPLGIIGKGSEDVLRDMGFRASFSCAEGMNIIRRDEPNGLFRLKRNIRQSGKGIDVILKKLEKSSKK